MLKFNNRFIVISFCLAFVLSLTACSQGPSQKNNTVTNTKTQKKVQSKYYSNIALYLAGMMPDTTAPFNTLVKNPQWISYTKSSDSTWKRVEDRNLNKIKHWRDTELVQINKETKTLFYPFSGPDFLYATTFFPNAEKYIMFGLEKTGSIPDMSKLNSKNLNYFLYSINKSLEDILNSSFFKTNESPRGRASRYPCFR